MPSTRHSEKNASISWSEVGTGDRILVWLPGIGFPSAPNFMPTATDPVLDGTRSILIDPPGVGDSQRLPDLSLQDHADAVAAVLDHLTLGPQTIVGYSMGGAIAAELALRHPDLVKCLVLAEGNLLAGGGSWSRYMAAVSLEEFRSQRLPEILSGIRAGAEKGDPVDRFILENWTATGPETLHDMARALVSLRPALFEQFLNSDLPRHYVYGAKSLAELGEGTDKSMPTPEQLEKSGVTVHVLDATGHDLMLRDPHGFATIVAKALAP